jgi:radical SAM-linked protein
MVQVNNTKTVIRFKFYKRGSLQYISHLDLVRTMNKIIVRAGLPLWYTEGFNPKPKMVFAAPLSIGTESECEFLDIRLNARIDPKVAMNLLNRNMTHEMQVTEAYYPDSSFTDLGWMSYSIVIDSPTVSSALLESINRTLSSDSVTVLKNTKSGEREVDIKPLINRAEARIEDGKIMIDAVLSADQSKFLNPELIIKVLKRECGILTDPDLTKESYFIKRLDAYRPDMTPFK